MLERLAIQNFQAHRRLEIEFDSAVTTIVGPSDVGKSAIIRALRWACLNDVSGDDFITTGKTFAKVQLTADGQTVTRKRGKENLYKLDDKKFKAFGGKVPPDVAELLNVTERNFQEQITPPYWFLDTPGQVSKNLNAIVNLGVIDGALAFVAKELRNAKATVDVSASRLQTARTKKKEFAWVPNMAKDLAELEHLERQASAAQATAVSLGSLLEQARTARLDQQNASEAAEEAQSVLKLAKDARNAAKDADGLGDLLGELYEMQTLKTAGELLPDPSELESLHDAYVRATGGKEALEWLLLEINVKGQNVAKHRQRAEQAQAKLIKATKGKCPVCGQVLKS